MANLCLVTGANGHLGNNLIRLLLDKGEKVRASVRNVDNKVPFEGLDCELVYADITDKDSLVKAMEGVDIVYSCAAVFKHWAPDPEKEIVIPNIEGTRNVLEAAAENKVKKIVHVSGLVAVDFNSAPLDESTWNTDYTSPYAQGKTEGEKLAIELGKELNISVVTIIPSGMTGPNLFGHYTTLMAFLNKILNNEHKIDVNYNTNVVDIRDVCAAMISAAEKGRSGERYILGNENPISTGKLFEIAQSLFPGINKPAVIAKDELLKIADNLEAESLKTGEAPGLTRGLVETWYEADARINISKAKKELDFNPRPTEDAVKDALNYLKTLQD